MKKIFAVCMAAAMLAAGATGCAGKKDSTIRIGVMPSENILPIVYADEAGLFEENGVDVEVVIFKSAVDRDAALQAGELDGVASDMLSTIFLNDAGFDLKITANDITNFKVISVTDASSDTPRTIGMSKSTVVEYISDKYIASAGGEFTPTYVSAVPVRLELLNNKELDMATLPEPLASVPEGSTVVATSNDMDLYPGVHMFSSDAIASKDIKAFYRAYDEAVDVINNSDISQFKTILTDSNRLF